jgi:regulator of protease activity HflC (stomatin/prohibitin superfamily)
MPFLFILAVLFLSFLISFFFIVKTKEAAVIETFGKFSRISEAGLRVKIPLIQRIAGRLNLKILELPVTVETKTKDDVFVKIVISVQYMVSEGLENIEKAFYSLDNPARQITSYVFDTVRSEVPNLELDEVFEEKARIAVSIEKELNEVMRGYGYTIVKSLVTDIDPDQKVKNAMNEINASKRLKEAAREKAEAEKIQVVAIAEADAESKRLQGEGIANQRKAIANGLQESAEDLQQAIPGSDAMTVMNLLMVTQYFDTLQEMAKSGVNTVFMPSNPGAINNYSDEIMKAMIGADVHNQTQK